jgi:hypothetical protein
LIKRLPPLAPPNAQASLAPQAGTGGGTETALSAAGIFPCAS